MAGLLLIGPSVTALRAQPETAPAGATLAAPVEILDLRDADEATVQATWVRLQEQLQDVEATHPARALSLYKKFLDRGGDRFGSVAVAAVSRMANLAFGDLRQLEHAFELLDWAINTYPEHPDVERLKREREAVRVQGQKQKDGQATAPPPVRVEALSPAAPKPLAPVAITIPPVAPAALAPVALSPLGPLPFSGTPALSPVRLAFQTAPDPLKLARVNAPRSRDLLFTRGDALGWAPQKRDRAVTALARQASGRIWVATEDSGVWRYDETAPAATRWKPFTSKDGLGDDTAYAMAVDKQDRVWVGTLNNGVSVWNGKTWRNYGVLDGPLGERIFDIAVCPTDGDVWMATSAGLTRYSPDKDSWSYITRAEGLPSDQVQALAFDKSGNLLVGTQCDGVALASASDGYKTWRGVKGPEKMPTTPGGTGLPTSLINDVLVGNDGTFYAATTLGLAWSRDAGKSWRYVRGGDYGAKVRGLYGGAPAGWNEEPGAVLAEDYVSCLAQDGAGRLWLGHWRAGDEVLEMESGASGGVKRVIGQESSGFVKAILPTVNGAPLLARYDEGMGLSLLMGEKARPKSSPASPKKSGVGDNKASRSLRSKASVDLHLNN